MKIQKFDVSDWKLPFDIDKLSKMNPFQTLWECNKGRLNQVAMTYTADLNYNDLTKRPMKRYITFGEMFNNIFKVYDALKSNGVTRDDVVAYDSLSTPELVYTIYACILAGCKFKPIDATYSAQKIYDQLSRTPSKFFFAHNVGLKEIKLISDELARKGTKIVLTSYNESLPGLLKFAANMRDRYYADKSLVLDKRISSNWKSFINSGSGRVTLKDIGKIDQVDNSEIIQITSTTGSTGSPKDIYRTGGNWGFALANVSSGCLDLQLGDRFFNCTVPWIDFGLMQSIHPFLCNGIRIDFDPTWTPEKNAWYVIKNNPEWWMGAPSWLDDLFTNPTYDSLIEKYGTSLLSNAKLFITGGAALFPHKFFEYQEKMRKMSPKGSVAHGYGMTEGNCAETLNISDDPYNVGKLFPFYDALVIDPDTKKPIEIGEIGELYVTGTLNNGLTPISPGYRNDPELQRKNFVYLDCDPQNRIWAKSGDKFKVLPVSDIPDSDVKIQFKGRYKHTLTCEGFNIDCDAIQNAVSMLKNVAKVEILGCVTKDGNQKPIICIEKAAGYEETSDEDLSNMVYLVMDENKMPKYYQPEGIVIFDKFPTKGIKADLQTMMSMCLDENGCFIGTSNSNEKSGKVRKLLHVNEEKN